MNDILRNNPDLAKQFASAAVNEHTKNAPGLNNMMNDMLNTQNIDRSFIPPQPSYISEDHNIEQTMNGPKDKDVERILNHGRGRARARARGGDGAGRRGRGRGRRAAAATTRHCRRPTTTARRPGSGRGRLRRRASTSSGQRVAISSPLRRPRLRPPTVPRRGLICVLQVRH